MTEADKRDLRVVVADLDAENVLKALLARHQSLGIRQLRFDPDQDLLRYSGRDPGCRLDAVALLQPFQTTHDHARVIFDRHGSGRDTDSREAIEEEIEQRLSVNGWGQRARVIVLDPELEAWVWSQSPEVATTMGWESLGELHAFLRAKNWLADGSVKPAQPKEAMEAALREKRKPHSARRFEALAEKVGRLDACEDSAFEKFLATLREWFPR